MPATRSKGWQRIMDVATWTERVVSSGPKNERVVRGGQTRVGWPSIRLQARNATSLAQRSGPSGSGGLDSSTINNIWELEKRYRAKWNRTERRARRLKERGEPSRAVTSAMSQPRRVALAADRPQLPRLQPAARR